VSEPAQRAAGRAIAALLNSAPSWLMQHSLDEQERDNLMENMVSGAIERLLAPKTRNWATTANAGDSTKQPTTK
jgi:hypothetical protein